MEKLLYVVWKKAEVSIQSFRQQLLGPIGHTMIDRGARALSVSLVDEVAVPGLRMAHLEPTGFVSIWMDTALNRAPLEQALVAMTQRLAGYLVLESVPIVNTQHVAPLGERMPGLYTVAFLEKPDFLTYEEWLDRWQGYHTKVAIETQSTFLYIQNVLVRPVTSDAPPWTAIVEEAFPAAAGVDPMVFYAADSPEQLAENQGRMGESCQRFIDFARLETHPMSAYALKR